MNLLNISQICLHKALPGKWISSLHVALHFNEYRPSSKVINVLGLTPCLYI